MPTRQKQAGADQTILNPIINKLKSTRDTKLPCRSPLVLIRVRPKQPPILVVMGALPVHACDCLKILPLTPQVSNCLQVTAAGDHCALDSQKVHKACFKPALLGCPGPVSQGLEGV